MGSYYEKLYSQQDKNLTTEEESDEIEEEQSKIKKEEEGNLDKDIKMEELVDAAFALKSNTAAGCDYILSRDIIELLDTSKESKKMEICGATEISTQDDAKIMESRKSP